VLERVLRDIELAMRLGVSGTPAFVARGALIPGERWWIEDYLWQAGQIRRRAAQSR
jgi:protein-disulfide isomerase